MKRRLVAAGTALLFAVMGGLLLLVYVSKADQRAMADLRPASVLVLTKAVPQGATSKELAAAVQQRELPGTAVAPGAATSLSQLDGQVTTTSLQPGEQLLLSRLVDPATLEADKRFTIPKGLHQVSVTLESQRTVAGTLTPGGTVGIFLSTKKATQLSLQKVLVTAVQAGAGSGGGDEAAPPATLTVTFALTGRDAQRVVFAAEHGTIWLSSEPSDAPTTRNPASTEKSLYS
jgi:pilus assembly protein CpaB